MRKRRRAAGIPESGYIYGGKKGEAQRRAWKKWHKQHPDAQKKMQKAQVEKVTPGYAARLLGGRLKDFPVDMLETKRALVLLNRKIKEMSNG